MGWVIDQKVIRKVFTVGPPPPLRLFLARIQTGALNKSVPGLRSVHNMADISGPSIQTSTCCRAIKEWLEQQRCPTGGGANYSSHSFISTLTLKCVFACMCFPAWVKLWIILPGLAQEHFCKEMFEGLIFPTLRCLAHSFLSSVLLTKTEAVQRGMWFPWLQESESFKLKMRCCTIVVISSTLNKDLLVKLKCNVQGQQTFL